MRTRDVYRRGAALAAALTAAGAAWAGPVLAAATPPAGAPPPVPVAAAPAWAAHATPRGPAPGGQQQAVTVYLAQPRAAAAARFAAAVSDPRSPLYRHFLTPAQYRDRFAPPTAAIAAVSGFLRAAGLRVGPVPANHLYVRATGTVASLDRGFHATLMSYQRGGADVVAPAGPVSVPAGIAPLVAGVTGLDTSVAAPARTGPGLSPAQPAAAPFTCSAYVFQHTAVLPAAYGRTVFPTQGCGYTPAQVHGAYETTGLLGRGVNGRGVTVAVLLFYPSPTAASDLDRFSAGHGVPPLAPGQFSQVLPASFNYGPTSGCPPVQQVTTESVGDLESVHNMAPGAHLVYVAAPDCQPQDIVAAINETVDLHLADVVTNSYGLLYSTVPAAVLAAAHQAFVQAAAEGMGFFYASGDFGDTGPATGVPQAEWPAADPLVTAVGGTSLLIGPRGREGELGWGTTLDPVTTASGAAAYALPLPGQYAAGSGGGPAQGYPQPAYQRGVVPPSLAGTSDPRRFVPDVAADADLATPVLFGVTVNGTYTEAGGFGTSVSSPLFAGLEALADQAAGGPHGFVNPRLYGLHAAGIFHDIARVPAPLAVAVSRGGTTYLDTLQNDTSLTAAPGYDGQTGLGSPDGAAYVAALAGPRGIRG
ncbi:MAG TPA: S53 family peptidase [Streptosporangiaceae bacterium]